MAIKVYFSENQREISVGGLYQWDFGQTLEIECAEIGSEIVEVHFACSGMSEAIVRACTFTNGVGTVTIPDTCLEQTGSITAWIYKIDNTQGHTIKTITLPITARIRPSASREVPADYVDKYAEALTAINGAIDNLEKGTVTVAKATHAVSADKATTATNAASASYARTASHATTANGVVISKDAPEIELEVQEYGEYLADKDIKEGVYCAILTFDEETEGVYSSYSGIGYIGRSAENEWRSFEIAVGDKFVYIDHLGDSNATTIRINTRGNKGGTDLGTAATFKLYRIASFSVG